jgi:hypothetical protein
LLDLVGMKLRNVDYGMIVRQKIALVATAHYLVRVMWAMLRHATTWHESRAKAA